MGKVFRSLALGVTFVVIFYCMGCGSGVVPQLVPNISQVSPQTIAAGSSTVTVTVVGTNFSNTAVILWNNTTLSTSAINANTLAATVSSTDLASPATAQLRVKDTQTNATSNSVPVTVSSQLTRGNLQISTSSLPDATVGASYNQALAATGGTAPYTWTITSGALPSGLSLSSSGTISGTATAAGSNSFVVSVTDSSSKPVTTTATLNLNVGAANTASALSITSTPSSGTNGSPYSSTLSASGGTSPYKWSISGSLPAGLSLNSSTGVISGTPTATGTSSFTVNVTDSGSPSQSASTKTSITIAAAAPSALAVSSSSLSSGTTGSSYSSTLSASGGTSPYTWSISSGSLPAGLSLASNGTISGTPTAAGTFSFTANVSDSGSPAQSASAKTSITIAAPALTITTSSLSAGTPGSSYSASLTASGGTPSYSWSVSSGSLPAGLSMASNGTISGTPTTAGSSSFTATVTDSGSPAQSTSAKTSITIGSAALAVSSSALAAGTNGSPYSSTLSASGGTSPYTWSISGSLPAGLSLNSSTGVISGTPTATGTASFTATVTDSSSPAQSASAKDSITIAAASQPQLAVTSSTLSSGTNGTGYTATLQATGGTSPYTWSYTGNLPAGLSLAATSGVLSGTPTATGTFTFTAAVSDNESPAQTATAQISVTINAPQPAGPGTTWYIRADGGTRYAADNPQGQCDGQADAAYPGSGTNQHCAFGDYRYLYDDGAYGNWSQGKWVIAGGDTVIIDNTKQWRVGWDTDGTQGNDPQCIGGDGPYNCTNPPIPAGTPNQHTRILGRNYASCNKSNMSQLFGGHGVLVALSLAEAQYVDVACLEITRHSQCITHGNPALPSGCSNSNPIDDYDSNGITTDVGTHDLTMTDLWIHGHTNRGIIGPIGGVVTCLRCDISTNGMAGWDFDDGTGSNNGNGTASVNGTWNFLYSTIEWSGCNQEYPAVDPIPVASCYSQSTEGYGDGVGTPPGGGFNANVDHSTFAYNTQDGLDLGHFDAGSYTVSITNSLAVGNNGQTFKWGANATTAIVENNLAMENCNRMTQPMTGLPSTYNANLQDFCRAGDALSFNFRQGGTSTVINNTIVTYAATTLDTQCWDAPGAGGTNTGCGNSTLTFENNIVLAYSNLPMYDYGGNGGPGFLYLRDPIGNIVRSNNLYQGLGHGFTCLPNELCLDPQFVNEPTGNGNNFVETELDNFNYTLSSASPAISAGMSIQGLTLDYTGQTRGNPPSIGAYEK